MPEASRRGFLMAAGMLPGAAVIAEAQSPAPLTAAQPRAFSMKLGVHMTNWQNLWRKGEISWEEIGRVSAELGFHGIELQAVNVENVDKAGLKRIRDALHSNGLRINAINIENNFLAPDFDAQIKMVRDFAELCAYFEAPFERIYLGRKLSPMPDPQAFEMVRKGLETCLPIWEKFNVVAAPEPPDVFRFAAASGSFEEVKDQYPAGNIAAIVTLLRVVNSKYFRYTLDTGCIPSGEKYIWPHLLAPWTVNMHIKEWQFNWRTNEPSETDYVRFLEPFKQAGYDGFLDLELRDPVKGGFDLGSTIPEVSAKLTKLKVYLERCIAA